MGGFRASGYAWDELDGVVSSLLACGGHQYPGSEQLTGERSHLCLLHKPSAHGTSHICGILILSLERSTLDHVQPQFLSQVSACCDALFPKVLGLQL